MQAVDSFFPQFDNLRPDPEPAPTRRARWPRFVGKRFGQLGHPLFEHCSTGDHLALVARDGASASSRRPRLPVGVGLMVIDPLDRSSHPHLSVHWEEPMEEGGGQWVRPQFLALVTFTVGVEDETSVIDASKQHHSAGRPSLSRCRGESHRLRHGLASCLRNFEPPGQLRHRIGLDGCFVHSHSLLGR
jgi:hypothetical protein